MRGFRLAVRDIDRQLNANDNKVDRVIFVAVHNDPASSERAIILYAIVVFDHPYFEINHKWRGFLELPRLGLIAQTCAKEISGIKLKVTASWSNGNAGVLIAEKWYFDHKSRIFHRIVRSPRKRGAAIERNNCYD